MHVLMAEALPMSLHFLLPSLKKKGVGGSAPFLGTDFFREKSIIAVEQPLGESNKFLSMVGCAEW